MFALMTFRMPDSLRRIGATVKAFALLEDAPPARQQTLDNAAQIAAKQGGRAGGAAQATRHNPVPVPSHRHRRSPRTRLHRLSPRRPGIVPAGLQPCTAAPVDSVRGPRDQPSRARCSRGADAGR